jgi:3-isopropylmalate/(R)-2-methylmalate dehydratase small subunit
VIAKSFARIFYRNSINIGLPLVECDVDAGDGDVLSVDFNTGEIMNKTTKKKYSFNPLPEFLQNLIEAGGLIEYTKGKLK